MTRPTPIQVLQIIALSLIFWIAIKVLFVFVLFRFFWGPG